MKRLILVRHAKASSDDLSIDDIARPLSNKGQLDAEKMGKYLREKQFSIDLMLTSPAKRAMTTATIMAEFLGYSKAKIQEDERIYENTRESLLAILQQTSNDMETIVIVGHNPSLSMLGAYLTNDSSINFSTGTVAEFSLNGDWDDIGFHTCKLEFLRSPE